MNTPDSTRSSRQAQRVGANNNWGVGVWRGTGLCQGHRHSFHFHDAIDGNLRQCCQSNAATNGNCFTKSSAVSGPNPYNLLSTASIIRA